MAVDVILSAVTAEFISSVLMPPGAILGKKLSNPNKAIINAP